MQSCCFAHLQLDDFQIYCLNLSFLRSFVPVFLGEFKMALLEPPKKTKSLGLINCDSLVIVLLMEIGNINNILIVHLHDTHLTK